MAKTKTVETAALKIVVLDRGWVFVGRVTERPGELQIDDACCVRFWGTSKGLGQLASEGPLSATKLDPCPRVIAPGRAVMFTLECSEEKWKNYR
jgi:hypothetical protein